MTEPTSIQQALASDLKVLGLTATAGGVLEGRVSAKRALSAVQAKLNQRQAWLDGAALGGTTATDTNLLDRVSIWCEKAKFVLKRWADELEAKP